MYVQAKRKSEEMGIVVTSGKGKKFSWEMVFSKGGHTSISLLPHVLFLPCEVDTPLLRKTSASTTRRQEKCLEMVNARS